MNEIRDVFRILVTWCKVVFLVPVLLYLLFVLFSSCESQSANVPDPFYMEPQDEYIEFWEVVQAKLVDRRIIDYYDDLAQKNGAPNGMYISAEILFGDTIWIAEALVWPWEDRSTHIVYTDEGERPEVAAAAVVRAMQSRPVIVTETPKDISISPREFDVTHF